MHDKVKNQGFFEAHQKLSHALEQNPSSRTKSQMHRMCDFDLVQFVEHVTHF